MAQHQISLDEANTNLFSCAVYLAEAIPSSDGHAEAMEQIVPRYLARGDVDMAATLADTIDDPFMRDKLLTFVAEKCAAIDDDEYAFQLVEAMEDFGMQRQAREKIALQKSAKNDFEKALEIAEDLEHPDDVLADVGLNQAAQGDEKTALEVLERIEFPYTKAVALQNIALVHLQKDESEKALEFLEKATLAANDIEYAEEQIRAFVDVANHFVEAKQNGKAIETFDKAKTIAEELDNVHRDAFLGGIAQGFMRAGSVDLADRTLDLVADKTQMTASLLGFSQILNRNGEREEALETLEEAHAILKSQTDMEIRDSRTRFRLWSAIAVLFARYEKPERAIETAREITDETEQTSALSQLAQIFTLAENEDAARESLNAIAEDSQRVFALIGASDAKNEREKRDEAIEILNEAAELAGGVSQFGLLSQALGEIARRFVQHGENDKGREIALANLETISKIRDESARAVALANLAELYEQEKFDLTDDEKAILYKMTKRGEW
jgi:tetratricopeptide (TPR) repeat protein